MTETYPVRLTPPTRRSGNPAPHGAEPECPHRRHVLPAAPTLRTHPTETPVSSTQQLGVSTFLPAAGGLQHDAVLLCSATHRLENTDQCGVNCNLSTTVEREAIHDTTSGQLRGIFARPHSQGPSTLAQHPGLCAPCTVMAKFIEWEGHTAKTHGQVKRRRKRVTRNNCGGMVVMRHVGQVIRTMPAPGPPWHRIVAWALGLNLAANNMSLNCCSVRLARAANLVSDCLVRNPPCHVWVVWLSGGLSMREVQNHEPPPIAWLPLWLPNSESLDHLPTVPPFALRRPGGEHAPSGDSLPNCSNGQEPWFTLRYAAPTLPWTTAMMRTPSYLLHTDSSPRPESEPDTPKSGGHGCERNVPPNQGSQPAEEN